MESIKLVLYDEAFAYVMKHKMNTVGELDRVKNG